MLEAEERLMTSSLRLFDELVEREKYTRSCELHLPQLNFGARSTPGSRFTSPFGTTTGASLAVAKGRKERKSEKHDQLPKKPKRTAKLQGKASFGQSRYWTKEENADFERALKLFKTDYKAISDFVGSRTPAQVRSHAKKYYQKLIRDYKRSKKDGSEGGSAKDETRLERIETSKVVAFPYSHSCEHLQSQDFFPSAPDVLESPTSTLTTLEQINNTSTGEPSVFDFFLDASDSSIDNCFNQSDLTLNTVAMEENALVMDHQQEMESLFAYLFQDDKQDPSTTETFNRFDLPPLYD